MSAHTHKRHASVFSSSFHLNKLIFFSSFPSDHYDFDSDCVQHIHCRFQMIPFFLCSRPKPIIRMCEAENNSSTIKYLVTTNKLYHGKVFPSHIFYFFIIFFAKQFPPTEIRSFDQISLRFNES